MLGESLRSSRRICTFDPVSVAAYDMHAHLYASLLDPALACAAERLAELSEAAPGSHVLDLATGTGAVARAAAARGATVAGIDASAAMLDVARSRSPGIDFQLGDARSLPFPAQAFDAVTCGLSVSHFDDRRAVFAEVMRVLRPSGRFVLSTWGRGGASAAQAVGELLASYVPAPAPLLDEDTWFSAERGTAVLREAGFEHVSAATHFFTGAFRDHDAVVAWALAWPLRAQRLARLDPDTRNEFLAEARRAVAGHDLSWRFAFNFFVAGR